MEPIQPQQVEQPDAGRAAARLWAREKLAALDAEWTEERWERFRREFAARLNAA